jgi:hypothetical protein
MGLEYFESPKLAPDAIGPITAGMVMQVTTVTNDPVAGLIQIVDMAAVEPDGARLLSDAIDTATPLCVALPAGIGMPASAKGFEELESNNG